VAALANFFVASEYVGMNVSRARRVNLSKQWLQWREW
jgi:hypothetical protein